MLLALSIIGLAHGHWTTGAHSLRSPLDPIARSGNVETLAKSLFTDFVFAFEITAVLLVIAVVGGVALARRSGHRPSAPTGGSTP